MVRPPRLVTTRSRWIERLRRRLTAVHLIGVWDAWFQPRELSVFIVAVGRLQRLRWHVAGLLLAAWDGHSLLARSLRGGLSRRRGRSDGSSDGCSDARSDARFAGLVSNAHWLLLALTLFGFLARVRGLLGVRVTGLAGLPGRGLLRAFPALPNFLDAVGRRRRGVLAATLRRRLLVRVEEIHVLLPSVYGDWRYSRQKRGLLHDLVVGSVWVLEPKPAVNVHHYFSSAPAEDDVFEDGLVADRGRWSRRFGRIRRGALGTRGTGFAGGRRTSRGSSGGRSGRRCRTDRSFCRRGRR